MRRRLARRDPAAYHESRVDQLAGDPRGCLGMEQIVLTHLANDGFAGGMAKNCAYH
jgi:hypothetical protein